MIFQCQCTNASACGLPTNASANAKGQLSRARGSKGQWEEKERVEGESAGEGDEERKGDMRGKQIYTNV